MTTVVISQPLFFPWVGLFEQIRLADVYVHYDDVAFSKGSFVNRVQLKTPYGPEWMTIPLRSRRLGQPINELIADDQQDWRARHLTRLEQLYRAAPYRDEMLELVASLYERPFPRLSNLLREVIEAVCRYFCLAQQTQFLLSSELGIGNSSSQRVLAVVRQLGGDRYVTGHGARNYLDHEAFAAAGICVEYLDYQRRPYPQQFGSFDPHVSILDLIANVGRAGGGSICSPTVPWREFLAREGPTHSFIGLEQTHVHRPDRRISTASAGEHSEDGGGRESATSHPTVD